MSGPTPCPNRVRTFVVTIGTVERFRLKVTAFSRAAAINAACRAEGIPASLIISVEEITCATRN